MAAPVLQIVVGSTRPGRVGRPVAEWFEERARDHAGFEVELVDLAEVGLPLLDEPRHPRLGDYEHEHTRRWSTTVARADAFVFVTPEYNHGTSGALKNAIDFLHAEWEYKPVGFVSYGGVSAGTRAVVSLKDVVTSLKMMPIHEAVHLAHVATLLDEERRLRPGDGAAVAAASLLDELARWTAALRPLRSPRA